jgi:hypothetical protein
MERLRSRTEAGEHMKSDEVREIGDSKTRFNPVSLRESIYPNGIEHRAGITVSQELCPDFDDRPKGPSNAVCGHYSNCRLTLLDPSWTRIWIFYENLKT